MHLDALYSEYIINNLPLLFAITIEEFFVLLMMKRISLACNIDHPVIITVWSWYYLITCI